jgi:hypothetical protein
LILLRLGHVPEGNDDRVTGELSRGNELPGAFLEKFPWLELVHENVLQGGQHFCYSAPNEILQGGRDTSRRFFVYCTMYEPIDHGRERGEGKSARGETKEFSK